MKYIDCVIPIVGADSDGNAEPLGSGILVEVCGEVFLVSATHVFSQNQDSKFYFPGKNGLEELTGDRFGADPAKQDVSVMHFTTAMALNISQDYEALPVSLIEMCDATKEGEHYCITGFPEVIQKIDSESTRYKAVRHAYTNKAASEKEYRKCRVSRETHIVIRHSKSKAKDSNGTKVVPPALNCMSGGAVWKMVSLHPNQDKASPRLVGITVEKHPEALVIATRINFAVEIIRCSFPNLGPYLPVSSNLSIIGHEFRAEPDQAEP